MGVNFVANVPAKMMIEVNHLLDGKDFVDIALSDKKHYHHCTTIIQQIDFCTTQIQKHVPKMTYTHGSYANDLIKH